MIYGIIAGAIIVGILSIFIYAAFAIGKESDDNGGESDGQD
jgi:hypothetical protein